MALSPQQASSLTREELNLVFCIESKIDDYLSDNYENEPLFEFYIDLTKMVYPKVEEEVERRYKNEGWFSVKLRSKELGQKQCRVTMVRGERLDGLL